MKAELISSYKKKKKKKKRKLNLFRWQEEQEQSWRQKCKKPWLEEGDINSKIFYRIMTTKKWKSAFMEILSTQGKSLVNEEEIVSKFVTFYMALYTRDNALCQFLRQNSRTGWFYLKIFSKNGVTLWELNIMRAFQDFFWNGVINGNLNETYICLISKKLDTHTVADFCPISLTIGLYKITVMVLSERLKKVSPS